VKALNFYSSVYHANLLVGRKYCTIRLGDKTCKYREGDLVWVTHGDRFSKRKRIFTAVLDRVEAKPLRELSRRDLEGENPDMRTVEDAREFLEEIYRRKVSLDDTVTVVYFSEVEE